MVGYRMRHGRGDWVLAACFLLLHGFLPAYLPDEMGRMREDSSGVALLCINIYSWLKHITKRVSIYTGRKIIADVCHPARCLEPFVIFFFSIFDSRDRQERWEGGVMTCDKGCTPDWRVHSMHLTHLRCKNTTKCHSLKPETQRQGNRWDGSEGEMFWLFSLGRFLLQHLSLMRLKCICLH